MIVSIIGPLKLPGKLACGGRKIMQPNGTRNGTNAEKLDEAR